MCIRDRCTAEELGLPFRDVGVLVMDTDLSPDGGPTTASRQTYLSGNAARLAARSMRERMQGVLAEKFDVPPEVIAFHEGLAYVDETRLAEVKASTGDQRSEMGDLTPPAQSPISNSPISPSRTISFANAVPVSYTHLLRTSKHRASKAYRHEMIAVLLRRVLPRAIAQARTETTSAD